MNQITSLSPVFIWMLGGIVCAVVGIVVTARGNKKLDQQIAELQKQRKEKSAQPS